MLDKSDIKTMKQVNVSVNAELTKERFSALWKGLTNAVKNEIIDLSGLARTTVYRVPKIGNISAKLLVSMAQTLNVAPQYLSGESDEKGECTAGNLKAFLKQHGYEDLPAKPKSATKKKKSAPIPESIPPEPLSEDIVPEPQPKEEAVPMEATIAPDFTEDEWMTIFRSALLRSNMGGEIGKQMQAVKNMLLDI